MKTKLTEIEYAALHLQEEARPKVLKDVGRKRRRELLAELAKMERKNLVLTNTGDGRGWVKTR